MLETEIYVREGVDELAAHYRSVIQLLGEDPDREGMQKTPMRQSLCWTVTART